MPASLSPGRASAQFPVSRGQTINILAENRYQDGTISQDLAVALLQQERIYNLLGQEVFQGMESTVHPIELQYGDIVVMMTDGVFHTLTWRRIEEILQAGGKPNEIACRIIDAVRCSNHQDNLEALCHACHLDVTAEQRRAGLIGKPRAQGVLL